MKKYVLLLVVFSILAVASQAQVHIAADAGYLLDSKEEYLAARLGYTVRSSDSFSHRIEVELGHTDAHAGGLKARTTPVTLNYRLVATTTGPWGYSVGAGAGFARTSINGVSIGGPVRLHDSTFALTGFAGLDYAVSPQAALTLGAKYLWVHDVKFAGVNFGSNDDVALTAGLTFRF